MYNVYLNRTAVGMKQIMKYIFGPEIWGIKELSLHARFIAF